MQRSNPNDVAVKLNGMAGKGPFGLRRAALVGASAAAMIVGLSVSAGAQTISYDLDLTAPLVAPPDPGPYNPASSVNLYLVDFNSNQLETGAITAVIDGTPLMGGSYPGTGFAATVTGNTYSSTAIGNYNDSAIPLPVLGTDGTNEGLGILNGSVLANTTAVASITGGTILLELTDFETGTATLSNNTALASTTGNSSLGMVSGDLPVGFVSGLQGSVDGNFTSGVLALDTAGTVNITNVQTNFQAGYFAGSQAVVSGQTVEFDHDATADIAVTATMTVSGNSIDAQYAGNATRNIFLAENGGGLAFTGSAVVANSQSNIEVSGAGPVLAASAIVTGSSITATIGDAGTPPLTDLLSIFNMTGNSIGATATGNSAAGVGASGQPVVGNAIAFAPGIDVIGGDTTQSNVLAIPSSDVIDVDMQGDLVLISSQGNQGTFLSAGVFGGAITAYAETISAGGGVNLSGNEVAAATTGNNALNLIEAGRATVIDAIVVAGNLQTNDNTPLTAQNTGAAITVTAGAGEVLTGSVIINENAITAAATGNRSGVSSLPTVSLEAVELTSAGGAAVVGADFGALALPEYGTLTTDGGITASNLQINYGEGITITSNVAESAIVALLLGGAPSVTDGVVTLNDNLFASDAAGNVAFTGIDLAGDSGSFSAAVSSGQYNVVDVGATLTQNQVTVYGDDLIGTVATQSGNRLGSSAVANSANNSLDVTGFTDLTLGVGAGGLGSPSASMPVALSTDSSATGALVVLNNQGNEGAVSANTTNTSSAFVSMVVNDVTTGSAVTIRENAVSSSAIVNQATNTLTIESDSLTTPDLLADQIATVANRQSSLGGGATATTDASAAPGGIGLLATGDLTDAIVSVRDNDLSAFAGGNLGTSSIEYVGGVYESGAPETAMGGSNILTTANQFDVDAEFSLLSSQSSGPNGDPVTQGGVYSATVTGGTMGVALTGAGAGDLLNGSVVSVINNDTLADARANFADNDLSLVGFSALSTSTGLQSSQLNGSSVSASVIDARVGIEADDYNAEASILTVSDNDATARAIGNTGFNNTTIDAEVLGGNAGLLNSGGVTKDSLLSAQSAVTGDYTVASFQSNINDVTASATGMYLIDLNDFAANGNMESGVATISDNTILAVAQSNTASNGLTFTVGTATGLSAALLSEQRSGDGFASDVTATAAGADGVTAGLAASTIGAADAGNPVSVSGNKVTAIAGDNDATNLLQATATATLVGTGTAGSPNATIDPVTGSQAIADFALFNTQSSLGTTVSATATPGAIVALSVGDVTDSPIAVGYNIVAAQATINNANNTLSLDGGTALGASASLLNSQTNAIGSDVTPSATAMVQGGDTGAVSGGNVTGSPLNVTGNAFSASASGNVANNALNATTTATYGGGVYAASGSMSGGVLSATASYSVLNNQSNVAGISATAQTLRIGTAVDGNVSGGSHMTVQANSISASGVGNSASNSITLSNVAGTLPSASLTSSQVNTASVSATVTGGVIGGVVGGVVAGSNATVTNNSIGATAIGNSAVNRIGVSTGIGN